MGEPLAPPALDTEPIIGVRQRDGRPTQCLWVRNRSDALRIAGLRARFHPDDIAALIYPDRAYFEESAAADRANGDEVYGPYETGSGLLGIVAMTARGDIPWRDPSLPDCPPGPHTHIRDASGERIEIPG